MIRQVVCLDAVLMQKFPETKIIKSTLILIREKKRYVVKLAKEKL